MPRSIQSLVEEQVAKWRATRAPDGRRSSPEFVPPNVITFSNALGSKGLAIAEAAGKLLGIPVYDREIIEHIAVTKKLRVESVETLDERVVGRLEDYVTALFREKNFDQTDYVRALTRTIMALWGHGTCVLIGRGGAHIVSRQHSLSVRTTAGFERRAKTVARERSLTLEEATRLVARADAERRAFIQRHFGVEIDDPQHRDLILNTGGIGIEQCAEIVAAAFRVKFDRTPANLSR